MLISDREPDREQRLFDRQQEKPDHHEPRGDAWASESRSRGILPRIGRRASSWTGQARIGLRAGSARRRERRETGTVEIERDVEWLTGRKSAYSEAQASTRSLTTFER